MQTEGVSCWQPIILMAYNTAVKGLRIEVLGSEIGNWEGSMKYEHMVGKTLPVLKESAEMTSFLPQPRAPHSGPSVLIGVRDSHVPAGCHLLWWDWTGLRGQWYSFCLPLDSQMGSKCYGTSRIRRNMDICFTAVGARGKLAAMVADMSVLDVTIPDFACGPWPWSQWKLDPGFQYPLSHPPVLSQPLAYPQKQLHCWEGSQDE